MSGVEIFIFSVWAFLIGMFIFNITIRKSKLNRQKKDFHQEEESLFKNEDYFQNPASNNFEDGSPITTSTTDQSFHDAVNISHGHTAGAPFIQL